MTRLEAIKALTIERYSHTGIVDEALGMAISALREQFNLATNLHQKQVGCKWISVEERLPEDGVRVLAAHDDGVVRIGISRGYFPSVVSRTHTKAFGIAEVTHWMPLPEPPEEG